MIPFLGKSNIRILHLAQCRLDNRTAKYFREAKISKNIERLDLSGNLFSDEGATHLVRTLKHAKIAKVKVRAGISRSKEVVAPVAHHWSTVKHHPRPSLTTKNYCTQLQINFQKNSRMTPKGIQVLQMAHMESEMGI